MDMAREIEGMRISFGCNSLLLPRLLCRWWQVNRRVFFQGGLELLAKGCQSLAEDGSEVVRSAAPWLTAQLSDVNSLVRGAAVKAVVEDPVHKGDLLTELRIARTDGWVLASMAWPHLHNQARRRHASSRVLQRWHRIGQGGLPEELSHAGIV